MVAIHNAETRERTGLPQVPQNAGSTAGRGDWLAVLRILLIVQGIVAVVATIEASIVAVFIGGLVLPLAALNLTGAGLTLYVAARIGRHSKGVRRLAVVLQTGWLAFAVIDMSLAIAITQQPLELVPTLTRIVLPLTIFRMLRTPRARLAFGVPPSRRQRRKAKKAHRIEGRLAVV